jgi:aspartate-semialdehyde dehydrogenase
MAAWGGQGNGRGSRGQEQGHRRAVTSQGVQRPDRSAGENALALFLVGDNLRKGAALNAVQIAELVADELRAAR